MIDLARRSGQIASLSARVVREGDDFSFEFGLEEKLVHRPGENEDAPVTHVYAVARLKDGGTQFEVMTRKQIELVRAQSKAGNNGLWVTHWEEMAKKPPYAACSNTCLYPLRSSARYQWTKRKR